ncbi:MAG TPA: hypothetical protein VFJ28_12925 [Marmoricola sp.]|nr:hypothetical protein [Marmoricola sp.]
MNDVRTWVLVTCALVLVLVLIRYARGPEHQRGDEVGAWSPPVAVLDRS